MNGYLFASGVLCLALGLVHSVLGEVLIFWKGSDPNNLKPVGTKPNIIERHFRIIWATWHLATLFGWGMGAVLIKIATTEGKVNMELTDFIIVLIAISMLFSSFLVFIGTKGRHPGWIVLLSIFILNLIGFFK